MQLDGSYFRGWIDHNGVAFSLDLLEWDRFLSGFEGSENSGREGFEGPIFFLFPFFEFHGHRKAILLTVCRNNLTGNM